MEEPSSEVLVVLVTAPSESAESVAQVVVERRLAACVNIVGPVKSVFRWDGQIQFEAEQLLVMKTSRAAYPQLEACIVEIHPYDVPEVLALPTEGGLSKYLAWVHDEVSAP